MPKKHNKFLCNSPFNKKNLHPVFSKYDPFFNAWSEMNFSTRPPGNTAFSAGDLFDDEEMLDWLTDPNTMEISDQIEKVNKKMFEKLIARNEFLTVFFCKWFRLSLFYVTTAKIMQNNN